jgi:hypothetical protein
MKSKISNFRARVYPPTLSNNQIRVRQKTTVTRCRKDELYSDVCKKVSQLENNSIRCQLIELHSGMFAIEWTTARQTVEDASSHHSRVYEYLITNCQITWKQMKV